MRLLLDTQAFLWWVDGAANLSAKARRAIAAPRNDCFLSLVSCWEMAIKLSLGKLRLDEPIDTFVPAQLSANRFSLLEISFRDTARVAKLPFHHRDPFDRLLVSQALEEDLAIVTSDPVFAKYGAKRIW